MIYNSAVEQIKGARTAENNMQIPAFRLATVSSLSNGRAYVQFYGETTASNKLYPYLEGYKPTVGDKVLLFQQGSTFIIAGKISKGDVVNNYYMTKALVDAAGYLTRALADTLYEPKGSSGSDIRVLKNGDAYFGFSSASNTSHVIGYANSTGTHLDLGRENAHFGYGYFDGLGGAAQNTAIGQLNVKNTTIYGTTVSVNTTKSVNVGTSSKQLNNVYANQFYQNGTAISTSDRRKKTGIKGIGQKYIDFFRKLKPRLFRFKDGESGRLHSGFIAQEVEEAAVETGIPTKDLAFLCIDENGDYGLRYEELIAIQTQVIQDLVKRVEDLEETIKGGKE